MQEMSYPQSYHIAEKWNNDMNEWPNPKFSLGILACIFWKQIFDAWRDFNHE